MISQQVIMFVSDLDKSAFLNKESHLGLQLTTKIHSMKACGHTEHHAFLSQ